MKNRVIYFIKRLVVNTLATAALSVFLMCIVALIKGSSWMELSAPFEILLVNFFAHIGFSLLYNLNMKFKLINYAVMLVYLIGIIIGFGFLFNWFAVNEIWIVCVVGVVVFIIAIVIDIIKINQDAKEINSSLQILRKRKEKTQSE